MRICLFEDDRTSLLEPLSLTRPVFDLICGTSALREKQCRHFAASEMGALIRPYLADLFSQNNPNVAVNDRAWLSSDLTLLVNGRWLPPRTDWQPTDKPHVGVVDNEFVYALVAKEALANCCSESLTAHVEQWLSTLPRSQAQGQLIHFPWDLIECNGEQIRTDFSAVGKQQFEVPHHVSVIGPREHLAVATGARIEPFVTVDTTAGPVIIDGDAVVTSFSRLEGPCYIGHKSHIYSGNIRAGTSLGPQCRIGGEVEAAIVHGFSNKYHDGFLGHAYVGEWVNLGAGTHNSDLRNDYGEVFVPLGGQRIGTGLNKVGCFIGDHSKTGLGTLINTGANIGAFANLLPAGRLAPKYVPSFANLWNGALQENADLEGALATAAKVMQRRRCELTRAHVEVYQRVFVDTALARRRAVHETQQRRLLRAG